MVGLWQIHNCANTWVVRNVISFFWIMYGFLVHILYK
jgi:hypothetical protein